MLLKIEHKKNCDISIGTFFNTVTTSMLSKLSPLFAIQRRPVYLFEHNNGRIVLWFYFPWRFWGFAVPWKGSYEKETSAKCRAGICFILYVQRAGVVSKTLIHIKKKAIDSIHVNTESWVSLWINDSRQLFSRLLIIEFRQIYFLGINSKRIKFKWLDRS